MHVRSFVRSRTSMTALVHMSVHCSKLSARQNVTCAMDSIHCSEATLALAVANCLKAYTPNARS